MVWWEVWLLLLMIPGGVARAQFTVTTVGNPNFNPAEVRVSFSQPAGPSALIPANYRLDGQPATAVASGASATEVVLATPAQEPGRPYTITILGKVTSASGTALPGDVNRTWMLGAGMEEHRITLKTWLAVPGTQLTALTGLATFPDQPSSTTALPSFAIPPNVGDNYGVQLYGLFVAPTTGDYQFFMSSDDEGALYLSTDADPANMKQVAFEPSWNGDREYITGSNQASRGVPPSNRSELIHLTAGGVYHLEARMKEGGGGDNLSVTVQRPGGPPVVNGSLPLSANLFTLRHYRDPASGTSFNEFGSARITEGPNAVTVVEGTPVALQATADGSPPHLFQWLLNGQPIPGATGGAYEFVASAQTAGSYTVRIRNLFSEVVSDPALVQVQVDSTPPTVTDVTATESRNKILVHFSEPVDLGTATRLENYSVDGGLTLSGANLFGPQTIRLDTSRQTEGATYTLRISGVEDTSPSGNPMSPATETFRGWTLVTGRVLHERWNNAGSLADLEVKRAGGPPDEVSLEPTVEYPAGGGGEAGSFYVDQISGIFIPPITGDYVFYLAADDQANGYLSTDDDPAQQHLIAQETSWSDRRYYFNLDRRDPEHPENRSNTFQGTEWPEGAQIHLDASGRYSLRITHYEAEGGDHGSLTHQMEGETLVRDGAAPRFTPDDIGFYADPERLSVTFTDPPDPAIVVAGKTLGLSAAAEGRLQVETSFGTLTIPAPLTFQWQRYSEAGGVWNNQYNLAGQAGGNLEAVAPFEPGLFRYRVIASLGSVQVTSTEVEVTVVPDTFTPVMIEAFPKSSTELNLVADENLDPATAQQPVRYQLTTLGGDLTPIVGAALQGDGDQVTLTLQSPMTQGMPYLITATGLRDPAGNEAPPQSAIIVPDWTAPVDHILLPANPDVYLDFNRDNWITLPNLGIRTELGGIHVGPEGPTPHPGVSGAGLPLFGGLGFGNRALELTGNNRVEIQGGSPLDKAPGLTVMALVKPGPMSETKIHSIASQEGVFALRWYDWDGANGLIKVEFDVTNGGFVDADIPKDDQWHLITAIADGINLKLYVDDQEVGSRLSPILPDYGVGTGPIQVGMGNVFDDSADLGTGLVDLIALWRGPSEESFVSEVTRSATLWRSGELYTPTVPESVRVAAGERFELPVTLVGGNSRVEDLLLHAEATPGGMLSGALTVQGDASTRTVSGQLSPGASGSLTIRYSVSDGRFFSWGSTLLEVIPGINLPPEALPDRFETREDEGVSGNLLSNDRDPEGQALSLNPVPATAPTRGTVVLRAEGSFTYTPAENANGTDTFAYSVSDSQGATATATVTVTVTPRNDPPQFAPGPHLQFRQDGGPVVLQGWASDVRAGPPDEAGQVVTFQVRAEPSSLFSEGPAIAGNGDLSLTPEPGAYGRATVTVQTFDDGGVEHGGVNASAIHSFTIDVQRLTAELALSVATTTPELSGDVPGVVRLVIHNRGQETAGGVRLVVESEHGVTMTCPDGATCRSDSPHLLNVDLGTLAPDATATIEIPVQADGTEEGPIRVWGHVITTSGDTALNNNQGSVLLNVTGQTAPMRQGVQVSHLTFDLEDDPADAVEGGVTLHSEWGLARIRYVPTADVMYFSAVANGQKVADNLPLLHLGAPGDGQPVEKQFSFRIRENPGEPTVAIEWDYRITDDPGLLWIPAPKPTKAAPRQVCARAGLIGASLLYDRPPAFDPEAIDVLVDYAAHEKGFPNQPQGAAECAPAAISNSLKYLNTRFDLGLDPDALTLEKMKAATHWSLEKEGAPPKGTRDMEAGWWRDHKAKYMEDQKLGIITEDTTDPQQALEALRKGYDVEVEFFGHVAAMVGMGRLKNGRYLLEMAHDLYQDGLESGAQIVEGGIFLDPATRQVRGSVWGNGLASFIIERPANVRPQLPGESVATPEDTSVSGDIRATDHENDPLTFRIVTAPQHGRAILDDTGRWTYTPDPNYSGTDSFSVVADDGKTVSRPGTVTLEIAAVNDPPIAQPDRATLLEDHDVTGNVIDNEIGPDSDPDGDPLTAARVLVKEPEHGTAGVGPNGNFIYNPAPNFHGTDSFTYTVHDGKDGTATATVTVMVTSVNDEPFFVKGGDQTVNSDLGLQTVQAWATLIVPGPVNEDGQNVEFLVTTDRPDLFAVAPWVSPGGTLTYQPSPGANGVAAVTVRAKDDGGIENDGRDTSEPQTFTITVKPGAPIRLTINLTPDNTPRIHWVDPEDRLHLEVTPSLSPESWTPVLEGVEQQGSDRFFLIPSGEEGGYWRLQITEPLAPDPQSAAEKLIQKLDLEPGARVLIRGPVPPETSVVENSGELPRPEVLRIPSREGDYYIVIADPTPGLKHGHPMKYGWIDLDTQETGQASGEWPADILVPNEESQPYHLTDSTVIEQAEVRLVTGSGAGTVHVPAGPEDAAVNLAGSGCRKVALVVDGGDEEAEERHLADIMANDADRFAEWLEDNQFTVSRRSQASRHPAPHFPSGGDGPARNLLTRIQQIGATEFSCDPDPGCCHEFFLYVGSHGSRLSLYILDASGNGEVGFLFYDDLFEALATFPPCVKIVVFVDACYAGVAQNFLPPLCAGRPCGATIVTAVDVSWSAPGGLPFETDSATQDFLEPKARFDGDGDGKIGDFRDRWMHMKSERGNIVPLPATCPGQSSLCSTD